jgi:DNA polymerase elongation subunit (family B)
MSIETIRPDIRLTESAEGRPVYLSHLPLKTFRIHDCQCAAALTDVLFANEPTGILPEAVSEMIRLTSYWNKKKSSLPPGTEEWKDADRRSSAYKIAANSFYGVIGMPHSRFYVRDLAESVSQCGVWLIQKTIEAAKARGYDVIYGDTDSIFVTGTSKEEFENFVKWCNSDLYPDLMESRGCTRNFTDLAYEKAFERIVFVSAKRYVGRYSHYKGTAATVDSKPEIKGLEYKRGDVSRLTRAFQAEVMKVLMAGTEVPSADVFVPIVEAWKTRILEGELDRADIVISKRLAKPLNDYKRRTKLNGEYMSEPAHIAVARILKAKGQDVGEGTKIGYVVVDGLASPLGVVPADEWTGEFDRYYLWESLVYPPTQRLLASAFPTHDWTRWECVRPAKVQAIEKARVRKAAKEAQGSLFARHDPAGQGDTNAPQGRISSQGRRGRRA